ncbi:hypothetical protein BN946_scf184976.g33 [Trametes cinnabarina]|uniref:Uncharacterized protein n=1 Tax=Pycnoporus cinnabarinus TaxID=5643 RepID=A0A060SAN1_PYCCI|nr:hypothetical protein BN946_scf184976.g33 [Trametes cinnabarina]
MRKEAEDANPSPRTDETRSLSDSERHQYHSSSNEHSASDEPGDEDARNDAFHIELEDLWAYDPFAFDVDNVDHFQVPLSHSPSTSSSSHRHQGEDEHSIPSRPSVQFSRDTWWDALLAFYSTDGDSSLNMLLYFEVNTHPAQSWERTQSAMFLLDSLVRLFSLTTIDAGFQPTNGNALTSAGLGFASPIVINVNAPGAPPLPTAFAVQSLGITASIPIGAGISQAQQYGDGLPPYQQRWEPQPNPRAFDPPIQNPFYASGAAHSQPFISNMLQSGVGAPLTTADMESGSQGGPSTTHGHASRPQCGCNCAQFSLGKNWPSVNELAPTWAETIMWPTNLTDAEFSKEECRRLVWGSVMLIANLNAYASLTPGGIVQTGGLFVREYENGDDVWSLSLRAMLLLHSCLRVRASTTMSGAQRAEFAVRAWLEIDDIERRLERHTCGLSSNYGFQSTEMLFSLRICVSYEFQRFIPQVTT